MNLPSLAPCPKPLFVHALAATATAVLLAGCGGGGSSSTPDSSSTPPPSSSSPKANTAPVAKADAVAGALTGKAFTVDASASSDIDGDSLSYQWTLRSAPTGSTAELSDKTNALITFTPDLAGDYEFVLVVNDGASNSPEVTTTVAVTKATWKDADCSHTGSQLPACSTQFSDNLSSVTVQQDAGVSTLKFETLAGSSGTKGANTGIAGNRATLGMDFFHEVKLSEFPGVSFKSKDDGTGETGAGLPYITYSISKECDGKVWNNLITNLVDMSQSLPDAHGYVTYTASPTTANWRSTNWGTSIKAKDGSTPVVPANNPQLAPAASLAALIAEYPNACIYNWPNPDAADKTAKTPALLFMLGNSANTTAKFVWVKDLMIGIKSIF